MALRIITNNARRDVLYWHDLTEAERAEFDYLDTDERQADGRFFRYRGWVYDLHEFMRADFTDLKGWDGYQSDSYFSGIVVRYVEDFERIICGLYLS